MSLYDITKDDDEPLATFEFEKSPCQPIPRFDFNSRILFIAQIGSSTMPLIQINFNAPYFDLLNVQQFQSDTVGFVLESMEVLDVKKVEIAKAFRLTKDSCVQTVFTVRKYEYKRKLQH
jgi:hypothetical protein